MSLDLVEPENLESSDVMPVEVVFGAEKSCELRPAGLLSLVPKLLLAAFRVDDETGKKTAAGSDDATATVDAVRAASRDSRALCLERCITVCSIEGLKIDEETFLTMLMGLPRGGEGRRYVATPSGLAGRSKTDMLEPEDGTQE